VGRGVIVRLQKLSPPLRLKDVIDISPLQRPNDRKQWEEGLRLAGPQ
jgi:hypothetical protein